MVVPSKYVTRRKKLKVALLEKYGNRCACCGLTEIYVENRHHFFDLDHINNDGYLDKKLATRRRTSETLYRHALNMGCPENYQILCVTCNVAKMRNKGVCPHQEI